MTDEGEPATTVAKNCVEDAPVSSELPSAVETTLQEEGVDNDFDGYDCEDDLGDYLDISATHTGTGIDAKKSPPIVETVPEEEEDTPIRRSARRSLRLNNKSPELPITVPPALRDYNQPSTSDSTIHVPYTPAADNMDSINALLKDVSYDKESKWPDPRKNLFDVTRQSASSHTDGGKSDQLGSFSVPPQTEAENVAILQQLSKDISPSVSSNNINDRKKPPKLTEKTIVVIEKSFKISKAEFEKKRKSLAEDIAIVIKFTDMNWISCLKVNGPSPYLFGSTYSVFPNPNILISSSPYVSKKRDRSSLEQGNSDSTDTSIEW